MLNVDDLIEELNIYRNAYSGRSNVIVVVECQQYDLDGHEKDPQFNVVRVDYLPNVVKIIVR